MNEEPIKRGPGRPKKTVTPVAKPEIGLQDDRVVPLRSKWKMTAKPNWDDFDPSENETPDRLRIEKSDYPDGLDMQWVTDTVFGQSMNRRGIFERKGWTPVHQSDFDGKFNGKFMPRNALGEITVDGLVLMARPVEFSLMAAKADGVRARDQLSIKEAALRGGDLPVSLDSRHSSALRTNKIGKTVERLDIPTD